MPYNISPASARSRIADTELSPVILTPPNLFIAKIVSVTREIERPIERATLSIRLICLPSKRKSVQQKPGRKKTSRKEIASLKPGIF